MRYYDKISPISTNHLQKQKMNTVKDILSALNDCQGFPFKESPACDNPYKTIYHNQLVAGTEIAKHMLVSHKKDTVLVAQTQSGKSGTCMLAANLILNVIEKLRKKNKNWCEFESPPVYGDTSKVRFVYWHPGKTTLRTQIIRDLKSFQVYDDELKMRGFRTLNRQFEYDDTNDLAILNPYAKSQIKKEIEFLKKKKPNYYFVFIDEGDYGQGLDSSWKEYIDCISKVSDEADMVYSPLYITATPAPYFAGRISLEEVEDEYNIVYLNPGEDYYGLSDIIKDKRLFNSSYFGGKKEFVKNSQAWFINTIEGEMIAGRGIKKGNFIFRMGNDRKVRGKGKPSDLIGEMVSSNISRIREKYGVELEWKVYSSSNEDAEIKDLKSDLEEEPNTFRICCIKRGFSRGDRMNLSSVIGWYDYVNKSATKSTGRFARKIYSSESSIIQSIGRCTGYDKKTLDFPIWAHKSTVIKYADFYDDLVEALSLESNRSNSYKTFEKMTGPNVKQKIRLQKKYQDIVLRPGIKNSLEHKMPFKSKEALLEYLGLPENTYIGSTRSCSANKTNNLAKELMSHGYSRYADNIFKGMCYLPPNFLSQSAKQQINILKATLYTSKKGKVVSRNPGANCTPRRVEIGFINFDSAAPNFSKDWEALHDDLKESLVLSIRVEDNTHSSIENNTVHAKTANAKVRG